MEYSNLSKKPVCSIFIGMIVVALLGINFYARPVQAQIKLTYANFPPSTTFPCVQMERWKTEVEKRTNGMVKVETFPGGTLLPAKTMFDGVISGIADVGNLTMGYQPGRFPVSEAVDLPLGFSNAKVASLVLYDLVEKYNPKELEKVKILSLFTCPPSNLMTKTPVKSLKDLKGMELRVVGTGVDVLKLLGGVPVAMPQSDTPEAIQKGVVKGMVSSMEILKDFNFAAYCPYATVTNLQTFGFVVAMNKDKWNSLPNDVKTVLDSLRRDQAFWTGKYVDDHVTEALEWSKQKYSHQVLEVSKSDRAEIARLLKPLIDDYIKKVNAVGLPGNQILSDVLKLKEKYEKEYK